MYDPDNESATLQLYHASVSHEKHQSSDLNNGQSVRDPTDAVVAAQPTDNSRIDLTHR